MSRSSTSSSDSAARFGLRALCFVAPLLCLWGLAETWLWGAGESKPAADIADLQVKQPQALYGRAVLSQQFNVYKIAAIRRRAADVLVVGSSRSMQLKPICLGVGERGFNGGGVLQSLEDLEALTRLFERDLPRPDLLVVVVDPWWLKSGPPLPSWLEDSRMEDEALSPVARVTALQRFSQRPANLSKIVRGRGAPRGVYDPVGLGARLGDGFRADGSYRYGRHLAEFARHAEYRDREEPPVIERVRGAKIQYASGRYDNEREQRLLDTMDRLMKLGIRPAVLLPPHAPIVAEEVAAIPWMKEWFDEFYEELPRRLKQGRVPTAAARSGKDLARSNEAFFDGMHPGEVIMAELLLRLASQLGKPSGDAMVAACSMLVQHPASPLLLQPD